jgi:hypothetical protein
MRFAWLKKNSTDYVTIKRRFTHPLNLVMIAYNIVWWLPIILVLTGTIDYDMGLIAFFIVTAIRLVANWIRNNLLSLEQAEKFPLHA